MFARAFLVTLFDEPRDAPVVARASVAPVSIGSSRPSVTAEHVAPPTVIALRTLPENRLAMQIRTLVRDGQCGAALLTGKRLLEIDATAFEALASSDAGFSACMTAVPTPTP